MTRGWSITRSDSGVTATLGDLDDDALRTDGAPIDVEVAVSYSGLNYKDALAFAGNPGVARISPLVPGIDVVGRVTASQNPRWAVGDRVLLNGAGAGETRHGGLAERALLDGDALVATPSAFTDAQAAGIGTAGFTAMLAVLAIEDHGVTGGDVLVTGASGGLGSFAVALLSHRGYSVVAATGRPQHADHLRALGATSILDRAELDREARPLESQRFAAVIDSVGGQPLATALAQLAQGGAAVACGNAASTTVNTSVMPFILRGIALYGATSSFAPLDLRHRAWSRLASDLDPATVDSIAHPVVLAEARDRAADLLAGRVRGRLSIIVGQEPS